ncbi:hypothetical protein Dda_0555 [Drechslerella dactyloides]|uniref:Ribosome maturation protein SDO1/SBDS N-terminal domain-containing protein n=1 Tax=Drechslerella dactyloides TaxID=74499 RepID=A0AAD6J6J3_DREDA|nr:hypothetical protein Dda_0555 [Drechslerella dactyloides]
MLKMRGAGNVTRVHLQKNGEDFIVLVENADTLSKWKKDSSTPLVDVVDGFDVFTTRKHGAQGVLEKPSNGTLEDAFGTTKTDDIIPVILREGSVQTSSSAARESSTNDSIGSMANHR